ncbi:hypothetical protein LguiB_013269 [Lonicera macranthoides]
MATCSGRRSPMQGLTCMNEFKMPNRRCSGISWYTPRDPYSLLPRRLSPCINVSNNDVAISPYSYERANPTFTTIARHYRTLFRACARNSSLHVGEKLHASVITTGLLTCPNSYLHNPILHVYATCGTSCSARKVFDEIPLPHKGTVD